MCKQYTVIFCFYLTCLKTFHVLWPAVWCSGIFICCIVTKPSLLVYSHTYQIPGWFIFSLSVIRIKSIPHPFSSRQYIAIMYSTQIFQQNSWNFSLAWDLCLSLSSLLLTILSLDLLSLATFHSTVRSTFLRHFTPLLVFIFLCLACFI